MNRNPEAATALFTEGGTYQVTPFLDPMRGRKAIFEYCSASARHNPVNGRRRGSYACGSWIAVIEIDTTSQSPTV
jgi:hypothetical protein